MGVSSENGSDAELRRIVMTVGQVSGGAMDLETGSDVVACASDGVRRELWRLRLACGVSQSELGDAVGLSQPGVSRRERGESEWLAGEWIAALLYLEWKLQDLS